MICDNAQGDQEPQSEMGQLSRTGIGKATALGRGGWTCGTGANSECGVPTFGFALCRVGRRSDQSLKLGEEGEPTHDLLSLAGAVAPYDAKDFALFDFQIDIAQRPEFVPMLEALVVLQSDRGIRILLAPELGPAALQIFVKHVAVDHPEGGPLAEILNFDDGRHEEERAET